MHRLTFSLLFLLLAVIVLLQVGRPGRAGGDVDVDVALTTSDESAIARVANRFTSQTTGERAERAPARLPGAFPAEADAGSENIGGESLPRFEHSFLEITERLSSRSYRDEAGALWRETGARVAQYPRPVLLIEQFVESPESREGWTRTTMRAEIWDEWMVQTKDLGASTRAMEALGAQVIDSIPDLGLLTVRIDDPSWEDRPEVKGRLGRLEGIEAVVANDLIWPIQLPNDPGYQSHWQLQKIFPEAGWDYLTEAAINDRVMITAAIIDTGVNFDSADILPWVNEDEIPGNSADDDANGKKDDINGFDFYLQSGNVTRSSGHGVGVSKVAGSLGNNGLNSTSATWGVQTMAGIVFSPSGAGSGSAAVSAIWYAVSEGAKVVNCSFIGGTLVTYSLVFDRARDANVIIVAGSGNNGIDLNPAPMYPVCAPHDNVIGVGASTSSDARASYSNYSDVHVDVFAPASGGTSFAAPMVTSMVALLWADDPEAPYGRIIDRIVAGVDRVPALGAVSVGEGRVNLTRSLRLNALRRPVGLSVTALSGNVNRLTWTDQSTAEIGFIIERSTVDPASVRNPDDPAQMEWEQVTEAIPPNQTHYDDVGLAPGRKYFYRVRARGAEAVSARNPETRVTATTGAAPVILPPEQPVTDLAGRGSPTSIRLDWVDACLNETEFVVERSDERTPHFYELGRLPAGSSSYLDEAVEPDAEYQYRLKSATRGSGNYSSTIEVAAVEPAVTGTLQTPVNLVLGVPSTSSVALDWTDRSSGETVYYVERGTAGGAFAIVATLPADASSFSDTGLEPDTTYAYRVRVSDGATSAVSAVVTVTTPGLPAVLVAPLVEATPTGPETIALDWEDRSERETAYHVERAAGGSFTTVATLSPDAEGFTDTGLTPDTGYQYRVRVSDGATSAVSAIVTVTTPGIPAVLTAPELRFSVLSETAIQLSWDDTSEGESGYEIERDTGAGFSVMARLPENATGYLDTDLTAGMTAVYRVSAVLGESGGPVKLRYLRWTVRERRAGANSVQAAEFEVLSEGLVVPIAEVTNPGGSNPARELPANLIDGVPTSKWLDFDFASEPTDETGSSVLVFDLGSERTIDHYQWLTANDSLSRDPVAWSIEGSSDGSRWVMLDTVGSFSVPDARLTVAGSWPLEASGPAERAVSATVSTRTWSLLEVWRAEYFGATAATGTAADLADPDGDGWNNLEEFATLRSPLMPQASLSELAVGGDGALVLDFQRRWNPPVRYRVQAIENLSLDTWVDLVVLEPQSNVWSVEDAGVRVEESGSGEARTAIVHDRVVSGPRYLRLVIELP